MGHKISCCQQIPHQGALQMTQLQPFRNAKITDYDISDWPNDQKLEALLHDSKIYKPEIGLKTLKHKVYDRWFWGTWKDGEPFGEGIIFHKSEGRKIYYEGEIKGLPNGKGFVNCNDGEWSYTGQFKEGKADGNGQFTNKKQNFQYSGEWKNSKPFIGKLKIFSSTSSTQSTDFSSNINKKEIEGQIKVDLDFSRPGSYAKIQYPDGKIYQGQINCFRFLPDGNGELTFPDKSKYVGQFSLGEFDGEGKFTWADGSQYNGEYLNGKKHGVGKFTFASGNYYEGSWKEGKQHGYGIIFNKNNQVISKGEWQKGIQQGQIKLKQRNEQKGSVLG